ncbi:hypothetical protein [Rhizobium leguminosarum]|uniref:hypothetical protein n=1 Tax=Rhizobium leguminosarum TaxID=384 RepID=UPI002E1618BD|nr:hypothetical protein U8Q02_40000 [Rhizobium leguminosarum]
MTTDALELSDEIMRFLDAHANSSASYDPEYDEPGERYSSPDASELHVVAARLRAGVEIDRVPFSEWGSGGYSPYSDQDARRLHDEIVDKIRGHVTGRRPSSP